MPQQTSLGRAWKLESLASLTDTAGFIRARAEDSLFDGTQYLFVLTAVWLVYMLMMYHGNQVFLKNEGKRIGVFRALGMDRGMLKSRYLLENLSEGGGIILVSAAIVTGEFLIRLRTYGAYDSVRMFQRILADNPGDVRLFLMALLIAVTAFLGVSVVTLYIPLKNFPTEILPGIWETKREISASKRCTGSCETAAGYDIL